MVKNFIGALFFLSVWTFLKLAGAVTFLAGVTVGTIQLILPKFRKG